MYDDKFAEIYAAFYERTGKDYGAEAEELSKLISERFPEASSLLDVACGSGRHLESLRNLYGHVEGVELSAGMLGVARRQLPGVPLHEGDMRDFSLERSFSVATCLGSSIGHVGTVEGLQSALKCFARHVEPGGVIVVEPWWFPETFLEGYVGGAVVTEEGRSVARLSRTTREGNETRVTVHFAVSDRDEGLWHITDDYPLTLFERDEYEGAFRAAGCQVEYLDDGGSLGRGLFVGTRS
ncbi:dTDP-3-amino-3,4,6-trideoxy-alpha-D-glucopyranose [Streptomyces sp. YIM 130001]|nr:class I SAM-dependent methyltransferase [Streptomyces sp. YIM 130001]RII07925.1 dTDP-3-amino-3,4,6-trideoxy-alpha-D-glucopyranose [Streptomyces sp. YIM 130001]